MGPISAKRCKCLVGFGLPVAVIVAVSTSLALSTSCSAFSHVPALATISIRQHQSNGFSSRGPTHLKATLEEPPTSTTTVQDDTVSAPSSVVFDSDDAISNPTQDVVCSRGVCVLAEDDDLFQEDGAPGAEQNLIDKFLGTYLGPRVALAGASVLYGTNFPLGAMMNDAMVPSAALCARSLLAALALSPFLFKLSPKLSASALLCGCFTALGYVTQSLALVTVSPATVSFLGAAVVLVCPTLDAIVDKKPMGVQQAPQTWLAAALCLVGVGILEFWDPTGNAAALEVGWGDALSILQAVGFGTSFFLTERMMRGQPDQALPITAVQVSMTAFISMVWCLGDGWIGQPGSEGYGIPGLFFEPSLQMTAAAVAFTGLITTALNRVIETKSLGKVASAEASVILATEPLFAALFAALWLNESFGLNDYVGGALIILACLATALKPEDFSKFFDDKSASETGTP